MHELLLVTICSSCSSCFSICKVANSTHMYKCRSVVTHLFQSGISLKSWSSLFWRPTEWLGLWVQGLPWAQWIGRTYQLVDIFQGVLVKKRFISKDAHKQANTGLSHLQLNCLGPKKWLRTEAYRTVPLP